MNMFIYSNRQLAAAVKAALMIGGLLIVFLSGCVSSQGSEALPPITAQTVAPTEELTAPQWLRFGVDASGINTMDPHRAAARQERNLVDMIFNGLVRYKPGNMPEIEPALAVEIPEPMLKDGKQVWTVRLRQGVMCHPGPLTDAYELTSEDVVYSLQRAADPDRSATAREYAGMTFEVVDRYTVNITLDTPQSIYIFLPKIENYAGGRGVWRASCRYRTIRISGICA